MAEVLKDVKANVKLPVCLIKQQTVKASGELKGSSTDNRWT